MTPQFQMLKIKFSALRFCLDIVLLIFVATPCIGLAVFFRHSGEVRERFNRQSYTADAIGRALVTYEKEHNGLVPTLMGSLNVNKEVPSDEAPVTEEDLSQFHLLPSGTRSGVRPVDVVFELEKDRSFLRWVKVLDQSSDTTFRIYYDGKILLEDSKVSQ